MYKRTETDKKLRRRAGAYIKNLRENSGLIQVEISQRMDYTYPSMVSQIETGQGSVPPEQLEKYAEILGVDPVMFARKMLMFYQPAYYVAIFGKPSINDLSIAALP